MNTEELSTKMNQAYEKLLQAIERGGPEEIDRYNKELTDLTQQFKRARPDLTKHVARAEKTFEDKIIKDVRTKSGSEDFSAADFIALSKIKHDLPEALSKMRANDPNGDMAVLMKNIQNIAMQKFNEFLRDGDNKPLLRVGVYKNPNTGETIEKTKRTPKQLEQWIIEHGLKEVISWLQPGSHEKLQKRMAQKTTSPARASRTSKGKRAA